MHANKQLSGFCHFGLVLFMVLWQSPDTPVMSRFHVSARLRVCFGHSRSRFCLVVWVCGLEFARPHAVLSTCVLWCSTQFVFLSAACFHVVMSCVLKFMKLWVFSLAACSCPVLHMAVDLFAGHVLVFFVLCEHVAFVLVFCMPCALMSIALTPPIFFPDYWLICPTFLSSLPS